MNSELSTVRNIPSDVQLFDIFWFQITALIAARPEFSLLYIIDLLGSLVNLALTCYPDELEYVDNVFGFAVDRLTMSAVAVDDRTLRSLLGLLNGPVNVYKGDLLLNLLAFPSAINGKSKYLGGYDYDILINLVEIIPNCYINYRFLREDKLHIQLLI